MPAAQQPTFWQRTRAGSKAGFDKVYALVDKLGAPVNRLSNKLGSEAFWPTTLDKESDKAARILKSFCKDGFYQEETKQSEDGPKSKQKVLKKIPKEIIQNAKGLAIFTTMRTGLWVSGAGGSGILVARLPDGSWSPPSGIMLHTAGLGFLVGVDIYDCVVVINTDEALKAFSKIRCTLGGEVSAVAGPVGMGGVLESEVHKRRAPIFTYLKSRGFYAGVQIDGTIIIERTDENERFYGERINVGDILAGKVRHPPLELKTLMETLKAAQGDSVDESLLPTEAAPGDFELDDPAHTFGIPDPEDDDPFGVRALSTAGLEIKEAGTQRTPDSAVFDFNPSPTSPVWRSSISLRRSVDARSMSMMSPRSSWRASSINTDRRPSVMVEMSTQTDFDDMPPSSPKLAHSPAKSPISATFSNGYNMQGIPENKSIDDIASDHDIADHSLAMSVHEDATSNYGEETKVDVDAGTNTSPTAKEYEDVTRSYSEEFTKGPTTTTDNKHEEDAYTEAAADADAEDEGDDDDDQDDAIIETVHSAHTLQQVQVPATQVISRARLVEVPKRGPPPQLPPRNPIRNRGKPLIIGSSEPSEESPKSPPLPNRASGGSSPISALTRSESASSLESPELNSQLMHGFGRKYSEKDDWPLSSKNTKESHAEMLETESKQSTEKETLVGALTPAESPSPRDLGLPSPAPPLPGAFP